MIKKKLTYQARVKSCPKKLVEKNVGIKVKTSSSSSSSSKKKLFTIDNLEILSKFLTVLSAIGKFVNSLFKFVVAYIL